MDEALEALDLVADFGLEGVLAWILRLIGIVAIVAGLGLWLLTDMGLLVLPTALLVLGVVLLIVPEVLTGILELA